MSRTWTEEQKKVIDVRNKNVLVSAAAGSGKTAVLVERILSIVCGDMDGEEPVDVDRLLVVTFTKAAAAEMRERVGLALEQRLEAKPENEHLQKQQTLIHNAQITTIDSFCQYVIRNYFHQIDLDPAFRIGDEGELKLLKGEVVRELLEASYAEEDPQKRFSFTEFVEAYATGKSDEVLETLILQLYETAVSYPYPKRWLSSCLEAYRTDTIEKMQESAWMRFLLSLAKQTFSSLAGEIQDMITFCRTPGAPYMYEDALRSDLEQAEELAACQTYEEIRNALLGLSFARLSAKKDADVEEEKKDQIKVFREGMKKSLKDLREKYFGLDFGAAFAVLKKAAPAAEELIRLTAKFADLYQERKRLKNLADFQDLEHLALEILVRDVRREEGKMLIEPSDAARELAGRYVQIMIDEYQDSNLIQEIILNSVARGQGVPNVFMVGDVKQSIYRFRLARPELFMEKYHAYPRTEDFPEICMDLHKNFRSRREVLEGTNSVFARLMTEAVGGICYDSSVALYLGSDMPEQTGLSVAEAGTERKKEEILHSFYVPEFLLFDPKDLDSASENQETKEQELTGREMEAHAAAACIRRLLAGGKVWDREKEAFRPVRCGDIVILLRSLAGWGDTYARVLTAEGIPAHTESRTGYFTAIEIQTLLNLLRVVDNPRQDIPLAAVLKSMIGGFSDMELAHIRSACPEGSFYEACVHCREKGGQAALQARMEGFFLRLRNYREWAEFLPIHELIEKLLEDTGYGDYLAAQPGGSQRTANVRMLVEKALAFEKTSYRGLFHFVRYIEQLQSYDEDFGEAGVLGENEDVVRIMTIHRSKGLEFPVVIVAGLGKSFNRQDTRSRVVVHPDLGIGVDWMDVEKRTRTATLPKRVIQKTLDLEMLGEELRVLYVAFTRAREKLILLGSAPELSKKLQNFQEEGRRKELSFRALSSAGTYLDWLLPAAALPEDSPFAILRVTPEKQTEEAMSRQLFREEQRELLLHPERLPKTDPGYEKALEERLSYVYPYEEEVALMGKLSVSELKRAEQAEEDEGTLLYPKEEMAPYIPRFMQAVKPAGGAARGTAYHRALECLDFAGLYHSSRVKEELERLVREGKMTREQAEAIRPFDIYAFAQSSLAERMNRARKRHACHTEQPFVIRLPARELWIGCKSEEPVLIQGIIDAYFYEKNENGEDEIVIVDYKTDYVTSGAELLGKYQKQLDYYGLALERLTGKHVKEKVIYSFCLRAEVPV